MLHTLPAPPPRPSPPTLLSATSSSLKLSLDISPSYELRGNDKSSLQFYLDGDTAQLGQLECLYSGNSTSFSLSGLQPAQCYHFRMAVGTPFGWSPLSPIVSFSTKPTVPLPPRNLRVAPLDPLYSPLSFLHIEWDDPDCDNGSPVLRFHVEMAAGKSPAKSEFLAVESTPDHSSLLRGLVAGKTYTICVWSESSIGRSVSPAVLTTETGSAVPDAVSQPYLRKQPASTHATIGWNEPTDNGSPILGYRVSLQPVGREYFVPGSVTTLTFNKLREETAYSATVFAKNAIGESAASAPLSFSTSQRGLTVPSIPCFLPHTQQGEQTILHWKEPTERECVQKYEIRATFNV